jgi:hypothetical protein
MRVGNLDNSHLVPLSVGSGHIRAADDDRDV